MKLAFTLILAILLFSCTGQKKHPQEEFFPEKNLSKLEQLMLLPKDSVIKFYDLSNDSIMEFPDLSDYTIKSLDLSHNLIDTMMPTYLPRGVEKLDLSFNLLHDYFIYRFELDSIQKDALEKTDKFKVLLELHNSHIMREINISHNNIMGIDIGAPLYKIIATHNDITFINFNHKNMQYIDISNNPNLSNVVGFDPSIIDTVISKNIANNKKLVSTFWLGREGHWDTIKIDSANIRIE